MRSKAHVKSHPIHPILVSFPIAFFTGTFLFDLLGWLVSSSFWNVGYYLEIAGILFAVLAAIPGLVDYIYTVPPKSSAKKRATKHALLNTTMLILFILAFIYRREGYTSPYVLLGIEFVGVIIMSIAGWLGGTLVYRNQIGVDHRYAHAGKWKEEYYKPAPRIEVGSVDDLKLNQMKLLHVGDKRIVLARTENSYVAFDDRCTHRGGSLAGGSMICGTVLCPWHGSQFDVSTGLVMAGPADEKINVYPVSESEGKIYLVLND